MLSSGCFLGRSGVERVERVERWRVGESDIFSVGDEWGSGKEGEGREQGEGAEKTKDSASSLARNTEKSGEIAFI